jgi:hypothetical protein
MGAGGALRPQLPFTRKTLEGPGQPAFIEGTTPLPPAGRVAALSGRASAGTHQQPGGTSTAASGDC